MFDGPRPRQSAAFLSYARSDDDDERITMLRRRLEAEIRKQTGEVFPIFQDREDIFVGEQWRDRVQNSINGSTLLFAVVTPSFLKSNSCREEVKLFAERERRLERDDLIIPISYIRTPALTDPKDEVSKLLKDRQFFDWGDLRFKSMKSNKVRKAIAVLAEQAVEAMERSAALPQDDIVPEDVPEDDGLGFIELLAESEVAMPLFLDTIHSLTDVTREIGENVELATAEMNAADTTGRPSSAKLAAVYRLAKRLDKSATTMDHNADEYLDHLTRVSGGINALIGRIPHLVQDEEVQAARNLLNVLTELAQAVDGGLDSLEYFQQAVKNNFPLSSTLRPVLRRIVSSTSKILPSREVFQRWRDDLAQALTDLDGQC